MAVSESGRPRQNRLHHTGPAQRQTTRQASDFSQMLDTVLTSDQGQVVSWEEATEAQEDLRPTEPLTWDMKLNTPPVAMPGRTKLI